MLDRGAGEGPWRGQAEKPKKGVPVLNMSMPQTDNAMAALLGASTRACRPAVNAIRSIPDTHAGTVVRQRKTAGIGNFRPLSLLDDPSG